MSKVNEYKELKEWYSSSFEKFESNLNGESKSFFHELRKDAISKLVELDFPTLKNEEWKYTNVTPILKQNFIPARNAKTTIFSRDEIDKFLFKGFDCCLLVFVNGRYSEELSKVNELPEGIVIDSMKNVLLNNPEMIKDYAGKLSKIDNSFNALNTAFAQDGLVIKVADGKVLENPVQVLFLNGSKGENVLSTPRNLIIAGKNSRAKVIFNYYGSTEKKYFMSAVTEVYCDDDSIVDIYKIQNEDLNSFHIEKVEVEQKQGSLFNHHSISFGGALVRNDINSTHKGERIDTHYYGLYLGNDNQHIDNHTFIDHAKPNCESNEVYKGILDDNSRGVFNGKIMVRPDAQKTNAFQSNKTILLSDKARIDTKPQLEIFADDVKCSHGATIGRLDEEAYFYIRSRGIPDELAKSMLIRAFANDVVESVKINELKDQLNHMIFEHLNRVKI